MNQKDTKQHVKMFTIIPKLEGEVPDREPEGH